MTQAGADPEVAGSKVRLAQLVSSAGLINLRSAVRARYWICWFCTYWMMPLLAPLPTHQVSASESHVVPRNDLVKLATPPLQVEVAALTLLGTLWNPQQELPRMRRKTPRMGFCASPSEFQCGNFDMAIQMLLLVLLLLVWSS